MRALNSYSPSIIIDDIRMFLRRLENENLFLYINWFFRLGALLILTYYFVQNRDMYDAIRMFWIRSTLLSFFAYNILTGFIGALYSEFFLIKQIKLAQILLEIGFYTAFYFLTDNPVSDVFLLFFLPLYIAARYLDTSLSILVLVATSIGLYAALYGISNHLGNVSIRQIFWLREAFLIGITVAFAIRFRPSLIVEVQDEGTQMAAVLKSIEDGVYVVDEEQRLLFVNDTLQNRHGPYIRGQSCSSYFLCKNVLCGWYPQEIAQIELPSDSQKQSGVFIDRDGVHYSVEVSTCPLPDEEGNIVGAIAFVQDIDKPKKLERHLKERVRHYAKRVETLISTRSLWLETYYHLSQRLSGINDPQELMDLVVEETMHRLSAESASLFLLEEEELQRKTIVPFETGWLEDESYQPGEGITGQVILPEPGSKYGKPIRNNHVDQDPQVVPQYLNEYKEWLESRQVKHLIAVPLNGREKTIGVLRVVNKLNKHGRISNDGFNEEDEDFMVTIASMVAISIENIRLLSETTRRFREIDTLYRVGQSMAETLDWRELLQVIVDEAHKALFNADKTSIYLLDESGGSLIKEATSETTSSPSGLLPIYMDEGIAGRVIKERKAVNIPDTRSDPDYLDRGDQGLLSMLVAPLLIEDKVIGTLSADSGKANAFRSRDQKLLEALASQAANAIEKARLYKQERIRTQQAYTMLRVSDAINSNLELEQLFDLVINELRRVVTFDSISIQLVDGDKLNVVACQGFKQHQQVMRLTYPADDSKFPNYRVLDEKKPIIIDDVHQSYPHFLSEGQIYQSELIRSWMGIPLIHHDEVIGMIAFDHQTPGFYKSEMQSPAETLANQIATAIVNSRLFQEKKREVDKLDTLYHVSTAITSFIRLDEVMATIVTLATKVASSDHTGVVLVDDGGRLFTSFESCVVGKPLHLRARPKGVTMEVINKGDSVFYEKVEYNEELHNTAILDQGFKSYAGLPIVASNKVLGVLFVHSYHVGAFESQASLLKTFCNHAAAAIEKAVLYQQAKFHSEMLSKLVDASIELIRHVDLNNLLSYCAQRASCIFDVEDGSLYLRDDDRQTIDLRASSTIPAHVWGKRTALLDGPGLTAYVARTGETLTFSGEEYKNHEAWAGKHEEPFLEHLEYLDSGECHSLLLGPLEDSQGKNLGVLKLENRRGEDTQRRFTDFEVDLHKTFASHIGIAIERALLYQRLDREARRDAREALGHELHEIANFVHGALKMRLEVSKEKLNHADYKALRIELERMSKATGYVLSLLRWIHYDLRHEIILQDLGVLNALEQFANHYQVPIETQVTGRSSLPVDVDYALYKIGLEAINNIAKHAGDGAQCTVVLQKSGVDYQFVVKDNGCGFDVVNTLKQEDTYGINTMNRWATSIGSYFDIDSHPNVGTKVKVTGKYEEEK